MYLEKYYQKEEYEALRLTLTGIMLFLGSVMLYTTALKFNFENYNIYPFILYALAILSVIPKIKWITENESGYARFLVSVICVAVIAISFAVLTTVVMWKYNLL